MPTIYDTGIRPLVDAYLKTESEKVRDYGDYWSASSAGYCMRKVIFDRLGVPAVKQDDRKTRVFESGHIFHEWMQRITQQSGLSVAQELELIDDDLMIKGHIDDLVLVDGKLILYDYKTQHSRAFQWQKKNGRQMSYFHKMQLGTYMYMLRKWDGHDDSYPKSVGAYHIIDFNSKYPCKDLTEARILKISKDDLCMAEEQLFWDKELEQDVVGYWTELGQLWAEKKLPPCTCADHEGGFMAREAYNPYFYKDEPCSLEWYKQWKQGVQNESNRDLGAEVEHPAGADSRPSGEQ